MININHLKNQNLSIQDIADMAGVSKTTVSFIINGKAEEYQISEETIRKVRNIIKRVQFTPNEFARGFRLKQTKTIGFVVGDVYNQFLSLLEKAIEIEARKYGFNLIIASSEDDPDQEAHVIKTLLSRSIDALIMISVYPDNLIHQKLNRHNIPIIYVDRSVKGKNAIFVTSDNFFGAYQLTEQFILKSCRRVAFIGGRINISTNAERFEGFKSALKEYNMSMISDLMIHREFTVEAGIQSTEQLFKNLKTRPDAILCASYTLFEGFLQYAKAYKMECLDQIKLATFDDHPLLDFLPFKVNSVLQNAEMLGKTAFDLVHRALQGKQDLQSIIVPSKLIIRDD